MNCCDSIIDTTGQTLVYCSRCGAWFRIKRIAAFKQNAGKIKKVIRMDEKTQEFLKAQLSP